MATTPINHPAAAETVEERFRRLADRWHQETDYLSSMAEAENNPAYQAIIGLGTEVVPLLLRDLEEHHTHWFAALEALTGAKPVPAAVGGNIPRMVEAWLNWARDHE